MIFEYALGLCCEIVTFEEIVGGKGKETNDQL